jgi:hypothetical protein
VHLNLGIVAKDWANAGIKRDVAFFKRVMADAGMGADQEGNVGNKADFIADLYCVPAFLLDINARSPLTTSLLADSSESIMRVRRLTIATFLCLNCRYGDPVLRSGFLLASRG